jgi:hypothetical protein
LARKLRSIVAQLIARFMNSMKVHVLAKGCRNHRLASTQRRNTMSRSRGRRRLSEIP